MGPNGSGKSTFANVLLGHPKYSVTSGDILVKGQSLLNLSTDERARKGIFLGFQYPIEIAGVGYSHFLRNAYNTLTKTLAEEQKNREVFFDCKRIPRICKEKSGFRWFISAFSVDSTKDFLGERKKV